MLGSMTQPFDTRRLSSIAVLRHGANQNIDELDALLTLLFHRGLPRSVVEIGCDTGGSLWLWRQLASVVVAVTLHTRPDRMFEAHGSVVITGDSTDATVQETLRAMLGGVSPSMVFVDGGHDEATVRSDLALAVSLVESGTVVVHDIAAHLYGEWSQVGQVWDEFKQGRRYTEIIHSPGDTPGYGILEIGD